MPENTRNQGPDLNLRAPSPDRTAVAGLSAHSAPVIPHLPPAPKSAGRRASVDSLFAVAVGLPALLVAYVVFSGMIETFSASPVVALLFAALPVCGLFIVLSKGD
jgi:hypothetical protein